MSLRPSNTVLFVDRGVKILKVYRRPLLSSKFRLDRRYRIAVGMAGHETPRGLYMIRRRDKDPDWMIPDSDWAREAGLEPGTIVSGTDPANPIVSRWLELWDGVGIHGTWDRESIGKEASHGCIRLSVEDVEDLYPLARKGTLVFIT